MIPWLVLTRRAWSQPRAFSGGTVATVRVSKVHVFMCVEEESDCSKELTHARLARGRKMRTEEKRARERGKRGRKRQKNP